MIDVLHHYQIEPKVRGEQATALCPLPGHPTRTDGRRRTASLSIHLGKGIFKCFGCQASGNALDFVLLMEGLNRSDPQHVRQAALKLVDWFKLTFDPPPGVEKSANGRVTDAGSASAQQAAKPRCSSTTASSRISTEGMTAPSIGDTQSTTSDSGRQDNSATAEPLQVVVNAPLPFRLEKLDPTHPYLASRGLTPEAIATFGLGFCNRGMLKDRIAIPLHSIEGELVCYAGRIVDDERISDDCPKYLFPGARERDGVRHEFHKSLLLYNAHRLTKPVEHLIVVEGFASVWWLTMCGFSDVVAVMGSSCSEAQGRLISDLVVTGGRITLLPDGDDAGTACAASLFTHITYPHYVRWLRLSGGNQPTDFPPNELAALLE
jgi:DNA primase